MGSSGGSPWKQRQTVDRMPLAFPLSAFRVEICSPTPAVNPCVRFPEPQPPFLHTHDAERRSRAGAASDPQHCGSRFRVAMVQDGQL